MDTGREWLQHKYKFGIKKSKCEIQILKTLIDFVRLNKLKSKILSIQIHFTITFCCLEELALFNKMQT